MIEPTVGRVVWYHPGSEFRGHYEDPLEPLAAHVARVIDSRTVNLMVIDANGVPYPVTGVTLLQEGEGQSVGNVGYCEWMPFQLGQAKRTEQAEALATAAAARTGGEGTY